MSESPFRAPSRALCAALLLAYGCASGAKPIGPTTAASAPSAACDPARDRAAILRMVGTFNVRFAFDETEALSPGYQPHEPYRTDATEVVTALEDTEHRIVLQHVLLLQKHSGAFYPLKHWRQDWTFEDRELWEYRGARAWERRELSDAAVRCSWTQAVFEVDDAPRYESYGRFQHDAEHAVWVSQTTWRPLPRREYTQRSDYDVIVGENRHELTPDGWLHLQDNVKLVLQGEKSLVRETGRNEYTRTSVPEAELARGYLERSARFWSAVRAEWAQVLRRSSRVVIVQERDGKPLHEHLFPLAEREAQVDEQRAHIQALLASYMESAEPSEPRARRAQSNVMLRATASAGTLSAP